jgi:hypothetical protein
MSFGLKNIEAINTYAKLASYASSYTSGWLRQTMGPGTNPVVTVSRSIRGIDEDRPRSFHETLLYGEDDLSLKRVASNSLDVAKPTLYDVSPSGTTISLFNTFYGASKEDKCIIEIGLEQGETYRIDASSVHGPAMGDSWFSGVSWSSDERYVVYVAMVKEEKPSTYFGSQSYEYTGTGTGTGAGAGAGVGAGVEQKAQASKYSYKEDWGEKYTGVGALGLYVLDTQTQVTHDP